MVLVFPPPFLPRPPPPLISSFPHNPQFHLCLFPAWFSLLGADETVKARHGAIKRKQKMTATSWKQKQGEEVGGGARGKNFALEIFGFSNRKGHCHSPICCSQSSTSGTKHFYGVGMTRDWYHCARLGPPLLHVLLLKHIFATGRFSGSWATRLGNFVNFTLQKLVGFMKFPANKICQGKIIEIGKLASFTTQKGFEALNFPLRCVFFFFFSRRARKYWPKCHVRLVMFSVVFSLLWLPVLYWNPALFWQVTWHFHLCFPLAWVSPPVPFNLRCVYIACISLWPVLVRLPSPVHAFILIFA